MHEQKVGVVGLQTHLMHHTGGHGEGRDTRRADHGVDLLVLGQKNVEDLGKNHTARGIEDEGEQAQTDDEQGLEAQEELGLHLGGDGETEEEGDQIGQHLLGGLGEAVQHAALADEVTEHEEADEGHALGGDNTRDDRDDDGEQDLGALGHADVLVAHADPALLPGGEELDDGGLDDGHQGHVGVGGHHDGTRVIGAEVVGHEDGGGAVCGTDDGDGSGVLQLKAHHTRETQGKEDTELGGRAEDHELGVGEQGAKVDHGTDADEQKQGEELVGDTRGKEHVDGALLQDTLRPLVHRARQGEVDQNGTEAHGQKQGRLHVLLDGQIDEQTADAPHGHLREGDVGDVGEEVCQLLEEIHVVLPLFLFGDSRNKKTFTESPKDCSVKVLLFHSRAGRRPY